MIDFHSHVLHDIDDGSHSVEESIEMMKMSYRQGIDTMVFTPPSVHSPLIQAWLNGSKRKV